MMLFLVFMWIFKALLKNKVGQYCALFLPYILYVHICLHVLFQ